MRKNENGRSMIEMLGVLAIIGVLSVGGIYGYTVAMRKYKANEIVQTASMLATMARAADAGAGKCVALQASGLETTPAGVEISMIAKKPNSSDIVEVALGITSAKGNTGTAPGILCEAINAIAPHASSTAGTSGYYITCGNAAVGADDAAGCTDTTS